MILGKSHQHAPCRRDNQLQQIIDASGLPPGRSPVQPSDQTASPAPPGRSCGGGTTMHYSCPAGGGRGIKTRAARGARTSAWLATNPLRRGGERQLYGQQAQALILPRSSPAPPSCSRSEPWLLSRPMICFGRQSALAGNLPCWGAAVPERCAPHESGIWPGLLARCPVTRCGSPPYRVAL
jgi:hypothetical protein